MPTPALRNDATQKVYKVVSYDRATNMLVLQGDVAKFPLKRDKAVFKACGYTEIMIPDAPVDAPVDEADEDE